MPLHDWTDRPGWDGVHQVWIVELLYWVKPRLPEGYRAYIGTSPTFAIDVPISERPDVGVRRWLGGSESPAHDPLASSLAHEEPDEEIAVAALEERSSLLVERDGRLIAAVELVSPRNKDRPAACAAYAAGYVAYLLNGVHLLLVDVHRRPLHFSFADQIAQELQLDRAASPPPLAISYRVGEPAPNGGRFLGIWHRALNVGEPLPTLPLPLSVSEAVSIDLEATYSRAAEAAYLS